MFFRTGSKVETFSDTHEVRDFFSTSPGAPREMLKQIFRLRKVNPPLVNGWNWRASSYVKLG
jgi:hypothetical protein